MTSAGLLFAVVFPIPVALMIRYSFFRQFDNGDLSSDVTLANDARLISVDLYGMLGAPRPLGDASLDGIVWNGSKGVCIGFDGDRTLVADINRETGQCADTSLLALERELCRLGPSRAAVVSSYKTAYQDQLIATLMAEGFTVVAQAHAGVADNLAYMNVLTADIAAMVTRVAESRPQGILTLCTKFLAAYLIDAFEEQLDLPIYASVLTGVCAQLGLAGIEKAPGAGWGRLFAQGDAS